jgi:3-oxoacyl-[acyl-carrier protein] reductase
MTTRIALVTGAARGIGAATAVRLAEDGLDVAVLDLRADAGKDTVAAIEATGRRAIAVGGDVTDEASVATAVEQVVAELGAPTVLVNNAGVLHNSPIHRMELADWRRITDVHLTGAFLMSRAAQKYMVEAGWGRIVNLSSIAAVGDRSRVHYSSAKAGLQGMTKTLALELGKFGVTVNCVAPGFTVTEMTRGVADGVGVDFEEMQAERASAIPVGRSGRPDDIAQAISFFVDERSGFVSGQVLYVAGGPVS